jgi:HK97 family phage portal protein
VLDTFEESQSRIAGVARRYHNSDLIFLYENHAIVYALVNKVMKQIASEGYHWVDDTGEQVENSETEMIEKAFSGTDGHRSLLLQMREMIQSMLITGDTYVEKTQFNARVFRLDTISPKYMRKQVDKHGAIVKYIQAINERVVAEWLPEEMYSEGLNNSNVYAISPVQAIMKEIQADLGSIVFNTKFFENSATPATMFILRDEVSNMSKEQLDQVKKQILDSWQGSLNAGKPVINNVIKEVKTIDRDLDKMQFIESRDKFIEKACAAFDMSKAMIGITDSANEATASKTMRQEFYRTAIRPYEKILERFINDEILPSLGFSIRIVIEKQDFIDQTERTEDIMKKRDAGLITTNESRVMLGLDPIEEPWADMYLARTANGFVPAQPMNVLLQDEAEKSMFKSIRNLFRNEDPNQPRK